MAFQQGPMDGETQDLCQRFPARFILGIMAFFGMFNVYSLRVNLSAAIVGMVDYEEVQRRHGDKADGVSVGNNSEMNEFDVCERTQSVANTTRIAQAGTEKYVWDANMQGLALGAYFYGYVCSQILGAWIGRRLGRVRVWGACMLTASICTLMVPLMTRLGFSALVVIRILIGLFSGVSYPLMAGIWSSWAPPVERGKLFAMQYAGAPVGVITVLPMSGFLAKEYGWQYVFYTTGGFGMLWSCLWLLLIYDSPAEHPRISRGEKQYVETSLGHDNQTEKQSERDLPVPWISIITSIRYWACVAAHFSANFATMTFLSLLPTYMKTVLNFDIKSSGAISSIPYIAKVCTFPIAGLLADFLIARGVKTIYVRKLSTSISLLIPGIALGISGYVGCNVAFIVFLFTMPIAFDSFGISGTKATMIEIAPAFSGITFAFANTLASSSGFTGPQLAGVLREAHRDNPIEGWRLLFWVSAAIYFAGCVVFLLFATSDIQEWAIVETEKKVVREMQPLMKEKEEGSENEEQTNSL